MGDGTEVDWFAYDYWKLKVEPYSPLNSGSSYEMGNVGGGQQPGYGGDDQAFFSELDEIRNGMATVNNNITRIESLHQQSLTDIDESATAQTRRQLEDVVTQTSSLNNNLANRIKALKGKYSRDPNKSPQVGSLDRSFKETLRKYQMVEKNFADRTREQMARQYRIVRPDATDEEVEQACASGEGQVFSQAVS
jgi:syntaxin 1B/2/3